MRRAGPALLVAAAAVFAGCTARVPPPKTQLEIREYQTRTFDTADSKLVMKAMLNVLQDDGYVVKNAVVDLGLITAAKEIDLTPGRSGDAGGGLGGTWIFGHGGFVFGGPQVAPNYSKTEVRDFTGNVSEFGKQTNVRVSFQRKVLDNRGNVVEVHPIDDPTFYQDFFSRMDKSLYLQKERLSTGPPPADHRARKSFQLQQSAVSNRLSARIILAAGVGPMVWLIAER